MASWSELVTGSVDREGNQVQQRLVVRVKEVGREDPGREEEGSDPWRLFTATRTLFNTERRDSRRARPFGAR